MCARHTLGANAHFLGQMTAQNINKKTPLFVCDLPTESGDRREPAHIPHAHVSVQRAAVFCTPHSQCVHPADAYLAFLGVDWCQSCGICGTHICGMRTQFVAHILGNPTLDVALSSDN